MSKKITKQEIERIVKYQNGICISIYMPVLKTEGQLKQDTIRLKTLIAKVRTQLQSSDLSSSAAQDFLNPLEDLLHKETFREHQSQSIVIFASRSFCELYGFEYPSEEEVVVGEHFYIKPLIPFLSGSSEFYVLSISKKETRFLRCDFTDFQEVALKEIPQSMQEAMRFNDPERVLQYHTNTPRTPGSPAAAIFHGHGVGIDDEKDDLLEYFRQVDTGVHSYLKNQRAPLILAAVDYFHPLYKKMNSYPHLIGEWIPGNPDQMSSRELYGRAKEVIKPYLDIPVAEALSRYDELAGSEQTSRNIETILKAARTGRVWNLFVQKGISWFGAINSDSGEVLSHETYEPGDEEVLNLAALYTLQNGGKAYLVDRDSSRPSAFAVLRY